jgi:hypothetical protein
MKAEFANVADTDLWLANVVSASKYDLYYATSDRELYIIKNVSTEPRLHGYVGNADRDDVIELADHFDLQVTKVKSFEWEHESTPSLVSE